MSDASGAKKSKRSSLKRSSSTGGLGELGGLGGESAHRFDFHRRASDGGKQQSGYRHDKDESYFDELKFSRRSKSGLERAGSHGSSNAAKESDSRLTSPSNSTEGESRKREEKRGRDERDSDSPSSSQKERAGSPSSSSCEDLDNTDSSHSIASATAETVAAETVDCTVAVVIHGARRSNANDTPIPEILDADNLEATGDKPRYASHKYDLNSDKEKPRHSKRTKSRRRGKSKGPLRISGNSIELIRQLNRRRSRSRGKAEELMSESEDSATERKDTKKSRHSKRSKSRRRGRSRGPLRISGDSIELIRQIKMRRSRSRGKTEELMSESEDSATEREGPKKSRYSKRSKSRRTGKSRGPLRISGNSIELIRQLNRRRSRSRGKYELMSEDRAIELKGPKKSRHSVKTKSRRMGKSKGPLRISGNSTELIRYVRQLNRRRSRSRGKAEEVEFESLSEDSATENEDPKQPGKSWRKSTRSWSRKTSLPAKGDIAGRSLPSSKLTREEESTTRNTKRSSFGEASISQAPQGAHAGAKSMLKTLGKFLVERKRGCLCCVCFWLVLVICAVGGWVILGMLQKESIVKFFPEDKNEVDDKALLFPSAAEPSIMPSQYPSAVPSGTLSQLTIVVMVQLDEDPDSVGFYLQSADNTMTYISRDVGSFAHLYHGQLVEEPALITLGTRVMFTFSGNGQYQIISYGEEMVTLISDSRESSYSFTAGLDDAKQINVVDPNEFDPDFGPSDFDPIEFDPNEYCLPCPTGNCGRCAWCEADKGFQPDVVYGYRCHSSPRSIPEECFVGDKRVQLINQHIEQIADCKEGFAAKPKYSELGADINLCVDEVFCVRRFYLQPDCDAELPGSTMVTETCQDLIGGESLGYAFTKYAPRKGDCSSESKFSADIAPRCCSDGVAFCSQHTIEGTSVGDEFLILNQPTRAPIATISSAPTSSLLPTWDGFPITVTIHLDRFPKETGLTLRSLDGRVTYIDKPPGSFVKPLDLVTINLRIPPGTKVELEVTDSQGDGFEGYFQVNSDSGSLLVVESGLSFESAISKTFVVDEPETLRPTGSPVPTASSEPTQQLYPITIELQLDRWSSETSMIIKSLSNLETLVDWTFTDEHSSELVRKTVMLPSDIDLVLTLFDEDGFCCLYGDGYVKVLDGESNVIFEEDAYFDSTLDIPFRVAPISAETTPVTATPQSVDFVDLTLVLQLDQFPAETSWAITSVDDGTIYESRSVGYYESRKGESIVETFRLPEGRTYRFIIKDLMGDGFCCSEGNGYYSLSVNKSTLLFRNSADFGLKAEHVFEAASLFTSEAPAPPTTSPSEKESPAPPTTSPSEKETPVPTDSPTSLPTLALHEVQVSLNLDSNSAETGFRIIDDSSGAVLVERPSGYFSGKDNSIVAEVVLLPASTYTLLVLDSAGDGFCCSSGVGLYTVLDVASGDLLLFGQGRFEYFFSSTFVVSGQQQSKSSPVLRGSIAMLRHREHANRDWKKR